MGRKLGRRGFLKQSAAVAAGTGLAASFEELALLARAEAATKDSKEAPPAGTAESFPKARIGGVEVSRLICGGNLISGYAHSRDLIYVSDLLQHYFSDEKVFETFRLCEAHGINSAMLKLDQATLRILNEYWRKEGGAIQWISQITNPNNLAEEVRQSLDNGAVGVFTTGQMGDELVRKGRIDLIAKAVEQIQDGGGIAGVSCHEIDVIIQCEKAGIKPDFYMKTFNSKNYWSAKPAERHDSVFEETPEKTIEVMRQIEKPWVAFKVLGAGAIDPREGFDYAVKNGADLMCVGMFDWQVKDDARFAKDIFAKYKDRARPWRA